MEAQPTSGSNPMENTSLRFAEAARCLTDAARPLGMVPPSFRSPPRIDADRSLRRRPGGSAMVAVRYRGRPWAAVLADMVEGVVAANEVSAGEAAGLRAALWQVLEAAGLVDAVPEAPPTVAPTATVRPLARVA